MRGHCFASPVDMGIEVALFDDRHLGIIRDNKRRKSPLTLYTNSAFLADPKKAIPY
jgi:hypothetical protein